MGGLQYIHTQKRQIRKRQSFTILLDRQLQAERRLMQLVLMQNVMLPGELQIANLPTV